MVIPTLNEFIVYYMSSSKDLKKKTLMDCFYCLISHHSLAYHIWLNNIITYKILILTSLPLFILSFLPGLFL